jgi:HK97 family phage major capsid protein
MELELKDFEYMWKHNGKTAAGSKMELTDTLAVPNAPALMPRVITNIVREAMEPLLVGTSLLTRINYSYGQTLNFGPAMGALVAADIPEMGEYPERSPQMGGATVQATIGKSGLAVKVSEEMLRYSQFDVIGMMLREAGRALARHKEVKIFNYIRGIGVKVFDNVTPASSLMGVCTGRDLAGQANGSLTMDNLFDAFAHIMTQGFIPNTLIMHPLTWIMFVKDPVRRRWSERGPRRQRCWPCLDWHRRLQRE